MAICAPPSTIERCEHRRPGPVRDLQELRVRGKPVHHRVPVLRQPAAQAGSEARSRRARRREAPRKRRRRRPRCRACAAARSRASAPSRGPTRRSRWSCLGLLGCLLWRTSLLTLDDVAVIGKPGGDWWKRAHRAVRLHNTGYAFASLGAIAPVRLAARAPPRAVDRARAVRGRRHRRRRGHGRGYQIPIVARRATAPRWRCLRLGGARPAVAARGRGHRRRPARRPPRSSSSSR